MYVNVTAEITDFDASVFRLFHTETDLIELENQMLFITKLNNGSPSLVQPGVVVVVAVSKKSNDLNVPVVPRESESQLSPKTYYCL